MGVRGHAPPEKKIENRGLPNCWKSIEIVNPSTTDLFLLFVFFEIFYGPIRRTFFLRGGGGGVRAGLGQHDMTATSDV